MSKFGTFGDYPKESLMSAEAALLTAWRSLDRYHDDLVLVGGLAVYYLTKRDMAGLPGAEQECKVTVADIGPMLVLKLNAFGGPTGPVPLGFQCRHPGGIAENSPAFQRWDRGPGVPSPEGTAENRQLSRPFGTQPSIRPHPALKLRAIFKSPSGTKTTASVRHL